MSSPPLEPINFDAEALAAAVVLFARSDPLEITAKFPPLAAAVKDAASEATDSSHETSAAAHSHGRGGPRVARGASFHDFEHRFWGASLFHSVFAHFGLKPAEFVALHLPALSLAAVDRTGTLEAKVQLTLWIINKWGEGFWSRLAKQGVVLQRDPSKNLVEQLAKLADDLSCDKFATGLLDFLARSEPNRYRRIRNEIPITVVRNFAAFYRQRQFDARRLGALAASSPPTKRAKKSHQDTPGRRRSSIEDRRGFDQGSGRESESRGREEDSTGLIGDLEQEEGLGNEHIEEHNQEETFSDPPQPTHEDELGDISINSSQLDFDSNVSRTRTSFSESQNSTFAMPSVLNSGGRSTRQTANHGAPSQPSASSQTCDAAAIVQRITNTRHASILEQLKPSLDDFSTTVATVHSTRLRFKEAKAQLAVAIDKAKRKFKPEAENITAADIEAELEAADARIAGVEAFIAKCDEMEAFFDAVEDEALRDNVSLQVDRAKLDREVKDAEARRKGLAQVLTTLQDCEARVEEEKEGLKAAELEKAGNDAVIHDLQRLLGLATQVEVRL
jgi:hypothetical protein